LLNTLGLLGPLDPEWLKENKIVGCPHPHVPSDHFPLLVEFELLQSRENNPSQSTNSSSQQSLHHVSNGMLLRR
jgi:mRNA deadenylase 3'-5' endonuclease subunit Ccr4